MEIVNEDSLAFICEECEERPATVTVTFALRVVRVCRCCVLDFGTLIRETL